MLAVGSRLVFGLKLTLSGVLSKLVVGVLTIGMGFVFYRRLESWRSYPNLKIALTTLVINLPIPMLLFQEMEIVFYWVEVDSLLDM